MNMKINKYIAVFLYFRKYKNLYCFHSRAGGQNDTFAPPPHNYDTVLRIVNESVCGSFGQFFASAEPRPNNNSCVSVSRYARARVYIYI